jgi:hypothetical protein
MRTEREKHREKDENRERKHREKDENRERKTKKVRMGGNREG